VALGRDAFSFRTVNLKTGVCREPPERNTWAGEPHGGSYPSLAGHRDLNILQFERAPPTTWGAGVGDGALRRANAEPSKRVGHKMGGGANGLCRGEAGSHRPMSPKVRHSGRDFRASHRKKRSGPNSPAAAEAAL